MEDTIIEFLPLKKSFGVYLEIPQASHSVAYVFYQSKNETKYLLATEKHIVMSNELRMGRYDRIMKINRGPFKVIVKSDIPCKEMGHTFYVTMDVEYYIHNPKAIYDQKIQNVNHLIKKCCSGIDITFGRDFSYRDSLSLNKVLKKFIEERLQQLDYITRNVDVKCALDDIADSIIKSETEHEMNLITGKLDAAEKKMKLKLKGELELQELETEKKKKIINLETQQSSMSYLGEYFSKYGINAGTMISQIEGDITGRELSDILKDTERQNRNDKIEMLKDLYDRGLILDADMSKIINNIILQQDSLAINESDKNMAIENKNKSTTEKTKAVIWNEEVSEEEDIID